VTCLSKKTRQERHQARLAEHAEKRRLKDISREYHKAKMAENARIKTSRFDKTYAYARIKNAYIDHSGNSVWPEDNNEFMDAADAAVKIGIEAVEQFIEDLKQHRVFYIKKKWAQKIRSCNYRVLPYIAKIEVKGSAKEKRDVK
jgi:hypothetical protein